MKIDPTQLVNLSKEEKLRLLDLIEEKKRRAKEKRAVFVPNAGQKDVLMSRAIVRAVFAGNGGGKTALGTNIVLAAAEGYDPWLKEYTPTPSRIIVVLDRPDKVGEVWLPEIKKWYALKPEQLHKDGKPYISRITFPNGGYVKFMFHEQEQMAFESIECDLVVFDEPCPRGVWVAMRRGGRTKGRQARFVIIGTPITASWMRKEIYEPWSKGEAPDVECFRFGTWVNKDNLADGYIEQFSAVLSEKEKRIRLEGEFFDLEGLALAHLFRREVHVLRRADYVFDKAWPCVVSIDPHPSKKHVAMLVGADPHGPVVLKELALKATPREFARALKEFYKGYRLVDIVCDNLGSAEMTGGEGFKTFIQVLQEEGVRVRPTTYHDKHDEDWITRIQDVLLIPEEADNFGRRLPRLRILEGCTGIIGDIETVQWAKYRNLDEYKPTLDIGAKDYLATLKYALATHLTHDKDKHKAYYRTQGAYGVGQEPGARRAPTLFLSRGLGSRRQRVATVSDDDDD